MSPYAINILLHYYARCDDAPELARNPPILQETIDEFLREGFLKVRPRDEIPDPPLYVIGERGKVYVEAMINLPWPQWAMPT